ncbi:uncharacterized protein EHS24_004687 [Apiotrichum porosum]|uniref:Transcription factor CBF/NF-Y/archaeal histone domain-containing protein n=1 Tax=Apiotrichum porosum TaxID=105984 RepID=A0A427Y5U4_9TREE|nr:uncharacterized protein EHS24_004687 [Apiotrichum porosum]RSH86432.1 hypothetical protein EHS24_004687 [Apiotrichum porosum]
MTDYDDSNAHAEASFMSHGGGGVTDHDDEHDDHDDHEDGQDGDRPQKKKRIIKSRQSLAEKAQGTTLFPLSRVKRIIKADKELDVMSSEATFLVAVATEYFIKHFMEEGYTKARMERRRIVNYKDMASVVSRNDEFDFLRDVVPLPITISEALEKRKARLAAADDGLHGDDEEPAPKEKERESTPAAPVEPSRSRSASPESEPAEELPPVVPSTNPLFPNAVVRRPPVSHPRTAMPPRSKPSPASREPRPLAGKNAPSTPHSLTTRSGRRSMNTEEAAEAADAMQVD